MVSSLELGWQLRPPFASAFAGDGSATAADRDVSSPLRDQADERAERSMRGVSVLAIGAGLEQAPIIRLARSLGMVVAAVDGNPRAPGLTDASTTLVCDLRDADAVARFARENGCQCVLPVPIGALLTTVGAVNDALGFRGISFAGASRCVDKAVFSRTLENAGLRSIQTRAVVGETAIREACEELGFPTVVKPQRGSGSRGVFVARDLRELEGWLPWHLASLEGLPPPSASLVQRYVEGHEVGFDGAVAGETSVSILVRDKERTPLPFRLGFGSLGPSELSSEILMRIDETVAAASKAIGLQNCLVNADILVDVHGVPWIVEMTGRPSGFNLSCLVVPTLTGVHSIHLAIRMLLGDSIDFAPRFTKHGVFRMFQVGEGIVREVRGIEQARAAPGVVACDTFLTPGDRVEEMRDGRTGYKAGYLFTSGESRREALAHWSEAASRVTFDVEKESPSGGTEQAGTHG